MKSRSTIYRLFTASAAVLLLAGCAMVSPELKEARIQAQAGNLRAAAAQFEAALPKASSRRQREDIARELAAARSAITSEVLGRVRELRSSGGTIPNLKAAAALLEREQIYDDAEHRLRAGLEEIRAALANAEGEYAAALSEAERAEKANSWSEAVKALERAAWLLPSSELQNRRTAVVERRDAVMPYFIRQLIQARNLEGAERELAKFQSEHPSPAQSLTKPLRDELERLRQEILEARVKELTSEKKYYTAHQLILDSRRDYLDEQLPAVRSEGAQYYKALAAKHLAEGGLGLGYAYFAAEKAWQLNTNDHEIFRLRREISDIIDSRITQQIAIDAFTSPSAEPQAGVGLSNTLMEHLLNQVPYGILILERRDVEKLLEEAGKKRQDLESKVKMWIAGDVTTLSVERQRSTGVGTAIVEKGRTVKPNTEYIKYMEQYGSDKSQWPVHLQHLTPEIEEPVTELVQYNFGEEILNGLMVVSVRTFESAQGAVQQARVFKSTIITNDLFNDEVALAAPPINRNPLHLPTDNAVKERLRNDLAEQIGSYVLASFEHRERQFLESAKAYIARREFAAAVADLAGGYHYALSDKRYVQNPEKDPVVMELRQLGFFDYTE